MNIYSLPGIISFTINFSMGLIVLLDNPRSSLNRWFAAFIFQFALWNISEIIILNSGSLGNALLGAQILYRIIFLAPAFFVIIAYSFPKNFHNWTRHILFYTAIFAVPVLCLSLSFPEFQIQLVPLKKFHNIYYYELEYNSSLSFIALLAISIIYIIWGTLVLGLKIPRLRTVRQRNQTRFLLFGLLTIFFIFIVINILRTIFERAVSFYFLSTITTFFISLFFLIAILQYRILKISRLISSGITYSILSSVILVIYFLIIQSLSESLSHFFNINSNLLQAFVILSIIILIRPLSTRLQHIFDRLLHKDIHQYRHNFFKLSQNLLTYYPPNIFFQKVSAFLAKNFKSDQVLVFIPDEQQNKFYEINMTGNSPRIAFDSGFIRQMLHIKKVVELYELEHKTLDRNLLEFLEKNQIRLILPLIFHDELLALVLLSGKKQGRDYSEDELEILSIFANEIAIAFHRNKIVEKLQQKERQRFRLQKLAALGQLTSGVAHEIRNPLNTISTAAETLQNKKLPPQGQNQLLQYILEETNRLNRVLNDFLNFSKLRPALFRRVPLEQIIERVVLALETSLTEKIEIISQIEQRQKDIVTDQDFLYQILLNLGINSLEAIRERCEKDENFRCENGKMQILVRHDAAGWVIRVIDNGIGIPDDNAESIFDPFFTTKKSGTGMGLSIVHSMIGTLGGDIRVRSKKGQTEFIISLPAKIEEGV